MLYSVRGKLACFILLEVNSQILLGLIHMFHTVRGLEINVQLNICSLFTYTYATTISNKSLRDGSCR